MVSNHSKSGLSIPLPVKVYLFQEERERERIGGEKLKVRKEGTKGKRKGSKKRGRKEEGRRKKVTEQHEREYQ